MNLNQQENNNQTLNEDLPVDEARQDEVKSGDDPDTKYRLILLPAKRSKPL